MFPWPRHRANAVICRLLPSLGRSSRALLPGQAGKGQQGAFLRSQPLLLIPHRVSSLSVGRVCISHPSGPPEEAPPPL